MRAESGPIGGDLSHEFVILASTGESEVFCHRDYLSFKTPPEDIDFDSVETMQGVVDKWTSLYAATSDKHDAAAFERLDPKDQISARGIEVGHIFYFGTKYSAPMKAVVNGPDGKEHAVHMGSYGIGPTRLAAALIEANHDDNGPIWPEAVAPFRVGLINLKVGDAACDGACARIYASLGKAGVDVLYDDRDDRPGREIRDHGSGRRAAPGDRGTEEPCRGQGGTQEPPWRRARADQRRCGDRPTRRAGVTKGQALIRRCSPSRDGRSSERPIAPPSPRREKGRGLPSPTGEGLGVRVRAQRALALKDPHPTDFVGHLLPGEKGRGSPLLRERGWG